MSNIRPQIGVNDITGKEISLGDIIEFYLCQAHGLSVAEFKNSRVHGDLCVEVVVARDMESPIPGHMIRTFFSISPVSGGCMVANKLEKNCKIIGTFPEDAKLLIQGMPHAPKEGPECDKLIEKLQSNPLVLKDKDFPIR